jgi:hypothetical protein
MYSEGVHVGTTTRDAEGCRRIDVVDEAGASITKVRACIPDAAYPFANDDYVSFQLIGFGTEAVMRFTRTVGDRLDLGRINVVDRTSSKVDGLDFAVDEDARCVHVTPGCGDVDVPVRMRVRTSESSVRSVVYGEAIPDPDGRTTYFILGAAARPVAAPSCSAEGALMSRARAWYASTYRAL